MRSLVTDRSYDDIQEYFTSVKLKPTKQRSFPEQIDDDPLDLTGISQQNRSIAHKNSQRKSFDHDGCDLVVTGRAFSVLRSNQLLLHKVNQFLLFLFQPSILLLAQ